MRGRWGAGIGMRRGSGSGRLRGRRLAHDEDAHDCSRGRASGRASESEKRSAGRRCLLVLRRYPSRALDLY